MAQVQGEGSQSNIIHASSGSIPKPLPLILTNRIKIQTLNTDKNCGKLLLIRTNIYKTISFRAQMMISLVGAILVKTHTVNGDKDDEKPYPYSFIMLCASGNTESVPPPQWTPGLKTYLSMFSVIICANPKMYGLHYKNILFLALNKCSKLKI